MSDNDTIETGAIDYVLNVIKHNSFVDYIYVNYENNAFKDISNNDSLNINEQFFFKCNAKFGLISATIVKKNTWIELEMYKCIGTGWIHVEYIIKAFSPNYKRYSYIIIKNLLIQNKISPEWSKNIQSYYIAFKCYDMICNIDKLNYNKEIKTIFFNAQIKQLHRNIPWNKKNNRFTGDNIKLINDFKKYYNNCVSFWIFDIPMLLTPSFIFKYTFLVYHKIKGEI